MARILLIDDESVVLRPLEKALSLAGHEVWTAQDGEEGLGVFRAQVLDLVIVDLLMPRKGGVETIHELRRQSEGLPILAISGASEPGPGGALNQACEAGASQALAKPFRISTLLETVDGLLSRS